MEAVMQGGVGGALPVKRCRRAEPQPTGAATAFTVAACTDCRNVACTSCGSGGCTWLSPALKPLLGSRRRATALLAALPASEARRTPSRGGRGGAFAVPLLALTLAPPALPRRSSEARSSIEAESSVLFAP